MFDRTVIHSAQGEPKASYASEFDELKKHLSEKTEDWLDHNSWNGDTEGGFYTTNQVDLDKLFLCIDQFGAQIRERAALLQSNAKRVQPAQCSYPDCKCPTETPCLKGLVPPVQGERQQVIDGLLEAVKHGGTRSLFERAAALLQSNAERVPLTDKQIATLPLSAVTVKDAINDVRIIEAAHGITSDAKA